jgi:8-oxo-dGTP pyrophosphatase MutT (NUDIX family)
MPKILGVQISRVKKGFGPGSNPPPAVEQSMADQGMGSSVPFSPGRPINPYNGYSVEPRQFDFLTGTNITTRPRQNRVSFGALQALTSAYDVAQMCIAHRIDSLRSFDWSVVPADGESGDLTLAIAAGRAAVAKPDGRTPWASWLSMYLQDLLRYDAGTLYKRRDRVGRVMGLEIIDGTTIAPLLDDWGRPPESPAPAFIQYANGLPWDWLTADDLIYLPFRPQPDSPYGLAPMESILLTANTDIRLAMHLLDYWADGSIPGATAEAPLDQSSPDQLAEFQEAWNAIMEGDQTQKVKVRWMPHGSTFTQLRPNPFDEELALWLFRKTCAIYSVTPQDLGITLDVNRATGDTQMDVQERIADRPLALHVEGIMTGYLQEDLGLPVKMNISLGAEKEDRLQEAQVWQIGVDTGALSVDEFRSEVFGLPIDNERPIPRYIMTTRAGPLPLSNFLAIAGPVDPETGAPADAIPVAAGPVEGGAGVVPGKTLNTPGALVASFNPDEPNFPQSENLVPPAPTTIALPAQKSLAPVRKDANKGLLAAGLVVRAADTGRVLMLQRGLDATDPAAGCWDWPGGHLEGDETAWAAACREWQEETGCKIPDGLHGGNWVTGIYQGFVWIIDHESDLSLNLADGRVVNPDDPDGDNVETVAWWDPLHVPEIPSLRPECRTTDWDIVQGLLPTVKELTAGFTSDTGISNVILEDGDEDEIAEKMAEAENPEEVAKELYRWRDNSRTQIKRHRAPRRFTSDVIPGTIAEAVWKSLEGAKTRDQVDAAFGPVLKAGAGPNPKDLLNTSA